MPSARHFLRCLNELRKRCLQGKAFGLLDLDRAVTEDGRIDRATLQKFGYDIGEKAFRPGKELGGNRGVQGWTTKQDGRR